MESAFGIEHGEISKARRPQQKPVNQVRPTVRDAGRKLSAAGSRAAGTRISLSDVGRATSKTVGGAGKLLAVKPGLTGAAVVGGTGYGLYRHNTKKTAPKGM